MSIVNYKSSFPNSLFSASSDSNFISITKLDDRFKRADGKRVSYELDYRSLSVSPSDSDDESWACVSFQEFTYWSAKELLEIGLDVKHPDDCIIDDLFSSIIIL